MEPTVRTHPTRRLPTALVLTAALLATGCSEQSDDGREPAATESSGTPHGYVEGAREAAEEQSRLILGDPGTGASRVLDLVTGKVHESAPVTGADGLSTDGRFGFFHTDRGTHVVDGGAWTVDHGDHVHYYRAAIRHVGDLPGGRGAEIRSDAAVTAATDPEGRTTLYDRTALEKGEVGPARTLDGVHAGAVVPYEEHLVALAGDDESAEVAVYDRSGRRVASPDATCERPAGDAVTRRGVVLGCADGALLVSAEDGTFTAERIPYGQDVPEKERATAFRHRAGSDTLTAPAGERAVWVLDVTDRDWTRVRTTGPVLAANTAGEGSPLLVLESDGALHGYDIATGRHTARTEPLLSKTAKTPAGAAAPVVEVDRSRAYVNDRTGKRVYEIDYNDALRVARSFDLDIAPGLMAETGR
ncbi:MULTISPECIES: hypothetical protein [Streptomyces]|uniref:Uncharacterized protein n=1 Tax=Streptomyces violaceoruber TaxID=1935 RepID=A0ACD4WZ61_STRVN|nr:MULTISPECIES: hypothetical protein [Streptomyces]PSK59659.1 hypothetical protein B0E38_00704 [Streptomyces sp. 111WW2]WOZ02716.1 hypothetical protein R2E43_36765 [Streptomyces violaceoruber]BDD69829.1 lipoprotein [Streptomyces coelicolor]